VYSFSVCTLSPSPYVHLFFVQFFEHYLYLNTNTVPYHTHIHFWNQKVPLERYQIIYGSVVITNNNNKKRWRRKQYNCNNNLTPFHCHRHYRHHLHSPHHQLNQQPFLRLPSEQRFQRLQQGNHSEREISVTEPRKACS